MSEDRLEKALQEMRQEDVDAGTLEAARARVWNEVTNAARRRLCGVPATSRYLDGALEAAAASCWKTTSAAAPRAASRWPR